MGEGPYWIVNQFVHILYTRWSMQCRLIIICTWIYFDFAQGWHRWGPLLILFNLYKKLGSVIHLNDTSPSECRHPSCWHTKWYLWIEVFLKNTIDRLMMKYIPHSSSWLLCHFTMSSCIRDSPYVQLTDHSRVSVAASREWMYSWVALIATRESFAGCPSTYPRICPWTFKHKNARWCEIS